MSALSLHPAEGNKRHQLAAARPPKDNLESKTGRVDHSTTARSAP